MSIAALLQNDCIVNLSHMKSVCRRPWRFDPSLRTLLRQTGCDARIPLLQKFHLSLYPQQVLWNGTWKRVFTEATVSNPKADAIIILAHTILQKEEIHVSLEINEKLKKAAVAKERPI